MDEKQIREERQKKFDRYAIEKAAKLYTGNNLTMAVKVSKHDKQCTMTAQFIPPYQDVRTAPMVPLIDYTRTIQRPAVDTQFLNKPAGVYMVQPAFRNRESKDGGFVVRATIDSGMPVLKAPDGKWDVWSEINQSRSKCSENMLDEIARLADKNQGDIYKVYEDFADYCADMLLQSNHSYLVGVAKSVTGGYNVSIQYDNVGAAVATDGRVEMNDEFQPISAIYNATGVEVEDGGKDLTGTYVVSGILNDSLNPVFAEMGPCVKVSDQYCSPIMYANNEFTECSVNPAMDICMNMLTGEAYVAEKAMYAEDVVDREHDRGYQKYEMPQPLVQPLSQRLASLDRKLPYVPSEGEIDQDLGYDFSR